MRTNPVVVQQILKPAVDSSRAIHACKHLHKIILLLFLISASIQQV